MKRILSLTFLILFLTVGTLCVKAQTAPPYKIAAIKIVPFNELTGEFEAEIKPKDERPFFNDVSLGLFITVIISGQTDASANGRKVEITVLKGGKPLAKKLIDVFGVGAGGKYFAPLYIESGLCQEITVTAKIIGQKTPSTTTRKIPFSCGE